jgi:N-acetylmuramoyl-L-alanine amidase
MGKIKVALSDGHGMETAGKRTPAIPELGGRVIKENEFNRATVKYLNEELKRCGFDTLLVAPTDKDTPLSTRTNLANSKKVDLYISIHYNAFDASFSGRNPEGFSAHIYKGQTNKSAGKFAKIALKHLAGGTKQVNRGLVEQDLHELRETAMPAVLFECGFMDNKREALLMIDTDFQKEVAQEIAKAVCEFYGVSYKSGSSSKPATSTGSTYKVKKGDSLWSIAKEFGMSVAKLKELNGLKSDLIKVGQTLKVSGSATYHTVKKGDSLWGIARKYDTSVSKIKSLNGLKSDVIHAGDKLRVK